MTNFSLILFQLSPEYLSLVQSQYQQTQPQQFVQNSQPPPRRPLSPFARQQQQLQTAYQNRRVPAIAPPRPRAQLHPQALAQAELQAEIQGRQDALDRAEARARLRASATDGSAYQVAAYPEQPKLGTFEQELLQLVSANQAQEFKLSVPQSKRLLENQAQQYASPQYPQQQQLVNYPVQPQAQYTKPITEQELPEQYHIETTAPRYPQEQLAAYQPAGEQLQYHQVVPIQQTEYARPARPYRPPAPLYQHNQPGPGEEAAIARAQANAEAQALAFQKIAQDSHNKHQANAFEQIRIVKERFEQQSALEKINQGAQVSEAGRSHIEEQVLPKDPEAAYQAQLKAQATAEAAAARRAQEAAEIKAHSDAIREVQAQQVEHVKQQERAHQNALNFERNQLIAQEHAQALANAQAQALYKAHQAQRAKANNEVQAIAKAQQEARKLDPDGVSPIQYLLPNSEPLPSPNSYFTNDQTHKYQTSGSSYVPRSAPKSGAPKPGPAEQYVQPAINQPRQAHKHKIPQSSQSSIYVSQSGLLKKAPVKSLTIEEIIDQDQQHAPQFVRIPSSKVQTLTQEDLATLINAGYTVTPVPDTVRPTQQPYALENTSSGYYVKKQRNPVARPEYAAYEDVIPRQRPIRKNRPILRQEDIEGVASEKVTFLVPVEPVYGTRQISQRRSETAQE